MIVGAVAAQAQLTYPETKTEPVVDDYFGTKVADPYRWLEDDNSKETAEWVEAQNKVTQAYLAKIPYREAFKNRLKKLVNYEKMGVPFKKNGKYYFYKNDGLQNQSVLYESETLGGKARLVLDPNKLSDDGTVALNSTSISKDGKLMAYSISRSGSDWNEIYVMDMATGKLLNDHIVWAKFSGAQWLGNGFFYSAYDAPEKSTYSTMNEYHKVYYHRIGTPQSEDELVFRSFEHPLMFYFADVSEDERFVYMYESPGHGNVLMVKDMKSKKPHFIRLNTGHEYDYNAIGNDDEYIYVTTNANAPNSKLLGFKIADLEKGAKPVEIIPEKPYVLNSVQLADDKFLVNYMRDAAEHIYIYSIDGKEEREIALPTFGSVSTSCKKGDKEVFYSFTSFTYPSSIFTYDMQTGKSTLYWQPKVDFNPSDFVAEQQFYTSKDGTRVPMFIVYKKGLKKNGKNPTMLYGYGGFNISLNPGYNNYRIPFLENGGIYVMANLRGGGEYGEDWHKAGTKLQKQNVFDDFIAAAEYLIKENYTSPEHLACNGGSNGGLLVGAVVNQRPDLFKAAVPQVGVMDMLRYHKFTIGWNWANDYGRSDDSKEMFEALRAYSPLHTVKNDGTKYPAIMVTTGDHDDRVVPAHSFKYAATLQAANTGNAPKIIRIDSKAGHGGGKPIAKVIDEQTDIWTFVMYNLGMKYKAKR